MLTCRRLGKKITGCVDMPDSGVVQDLLSCQPRCSNDGLWVSNVAGRFDRLEHKDFEDSRR